MSAYMIFLREELKDADVYAQYGVKSRAAKGDHDYTPLAYYGKFEVLEGPEAEGAVVLRFPSMEEAKAWYHSDAYQEAVAIRKRAADMRVVLVEGLD